MKVVEHRDTVRRPYINPSIILPCFLAALILLGTCGIAFADRAIGDELRLKAPEVYEHLVDFMVSLQLALFAVIGFFGRSGLTKRRVYCQIAAALVFVISGSGSLYFAYQSHLELMVQLAGGIFAYGSLTSYICEAWSLLVSAIATFIFVAIALRG